MSEFKELMTHIGRLHAALKEDRIDEAAFDLVETLFLELSKKNGYDPDQKESMILAFDERSKQRLMALEEKIENKDTISFVQEQVKEIIAQIHDFWITAGFNYIEDVKVRMQGVIEVKFGFSLDYGTVLSRNPVSAKKKNQDTKERLIDDGYILDEEKKEFIDCDINKEKIKELIVKRFPSAIVYSWETSMLLSEDRQQLQNVTVMIKNPVEAISFF